MVVSVILLNGSGRCFSTFVILWNELYSRANNKSTELSLFVFATQHLATFLLMCQVYMDMILFIISATHVCTHFISMGPNTVKKGSLEKPCI